ncbi:MAG: type IV toxin-antitoxin system AbiEi family antitoxin [Marmoricola sp.]
MDTTSRVRPADLADWLLAHGISGVTTEQAAALMGVEPSVVRIRLSRHSDNFVSPARGVWVPVAPEYREWGAPEGIEIVDFLMSTLQVDYYVGWLSAAALHGAAHHAPQVFQVAVARDVRDREVGRTHFNFLTRAGLASLPRQHHSTRSGAALVSTPEVTALDLATDIAAGGGIDNVATVLLGLAEEELDLAAIASIADRFPAAAVRRIGWILENLADLPADQLHDVAVAHAPTPPLLDPNSPRRGSVDSRWLLRINATVDAEF